MNTRIRKLEEVLLGLHQSPAHNGQVEAWEADLKAFEKLKKDDDDELRRIRSEAYHVASMYATFQSVIFIAVSQSNRLTCSLAWCPASISFAASVAAFLVIVDKMKSIGEVREDIKGTGMMMSALLDCIEQALIKKGCELNLETACPRVEYSRFKYAGYRFIFSPKCLSAFFVLTVVSLCVTYLSIAVLCKHCSRCSGQAS